MTCQLFTGKVLETNYTRLSQGHICNFTQKGYLIGFGQENISQSLSFLSPSGWEDFFSPSSLLPHASFSLPSSNLSQVSFHQRIMICEAPSRSFVTRSLGLLLSLLSTLLLFGFNQEARISL
jgi:hypothetical protein